jgi:trimeric autotransporter adhesin
VITNVVTWTSSAPTLASVAGGKVTALSGGGTIITALFGGVSGGSTITVDASQLTSIQISPPSASIAQHAGTAFRAIGTFADGNTQELTTFATWTSSQPSVATINLGHATGLEPGTATIVALFDGQVGTASLTVTSAAAASQMVSPAATNFEHGDVMQFHDLPISAPRFEIQ